MLEEKGRVRLTQDLEKSVYDAIAESNVRVVSVTTEIAIETGRLSDFNHFDPADRVIVATARMEDAVLITADRTFQQL